MAMNRTVTDAIRSEEGTIVLLMALITPVLLGFMALTIDVGFMYDTRNRLYAAADAAAKSAALEIQRVVNAGGSADNANINAYALHVINEQITAGYLPANTAEAPIIRRCSDAGATCTTYAGNPNFVEVILRAPTPMLFGHMVGFTEMTPSARAVAGSDGGAVAMAE